MSEDYGLIMVMRVEDKPRFVLEGSWTLPCDYCGKVCYVEPDALLSTKFVGLFDGAPTVLPLRKKLCCMRCLGEAAKEADNFSEADRLKMAEFSRNFGAAIDAHGRKRRRG